MKILKRTIWRGLLVLTILLIIAGVVLPRIDAGRFGNRVKAGLEQALGRKVEFGKVRLDLLGGPGFSVERVVIHDDPAVSAEPLAYVESLQARISLRSLWTGRLEFSNLLLDNPSVNLAKPAEGHWNFEPLLAPTAPPSPAPAPTGQPAPPLPRIEVRDGRINVKLADTKSIFYVAQARLDADPPDSPGGYWRFRFQGVPSRTDSPTRSFGQFSIRGRWRPGSGIDASITLERSSLAEFIRLLHGYDVGVHGRVRGDIKVIGPAEAIAIAGRIEVADVHRWDLLPPYEGLWTTNIRGSLDLTSQTLELATVPDEGAPPQPVSVQFRASGWMAQPHWAAMVQLRRCPLPPLVALGRQMGVPVQQKIGVAGEVSGVVGYSPASRVQGTVVVENAAVSFPDTPPAAATRAEIRFDAQGARLAPAQFSSDNWAATVAGQYGWEDQVLSGTITSSGRRAAGEPLAASPLFSGIPVLGQCNGGKWRAELAYRTVPTQSPEWSGTFQVENTSLTVSGFAVPLQLASAHATFQGGGLTIDRLSGRAGELQFKGDYRYASAAEVPHVVRVTVPSLDMAELERVLMPSLHRDESLLQRALGRSPIPEWLAQRQADTILDVGTLTVSGLQFGKAKARVRWNGPTVEIPELTAKYGDGSMTAHITASLRRADPAYRATARFRGVRWNNASWEGRGTLQTSGTGADLLSNLRFETTFAGRDVVLAASTEASSLSGSCTFAVSGGVPSLKFSGLEMVVGESTLKGEGTTGPDGKLLLDFTDGQKQYRMSGTLTPFQFDFAERTASAL